MNDASDQDLWGGYLNDDLDIIDTVMKQNADLAAGTTSTKTASFTVTTADQNTTFLIDATLGNVTVTLDPAATLGDGFNVAFKKTDASAFTITIDPNGGETIDGAATYVITDQYEYIAIRTNGLNWFVESAEPVLTLATAAETLAGVISTLGISPASFAGNKSLAAKGHYKLPGGLIIQWGSAVDNVTETFSTPFVSAPYAIVGNWYYTAAPGTSAAGVVIDSTSITNTSFKAYLGAQGFGDVISYIAIGV